MATTKACGSGKTRYPTHQAAQEALARIAEAPDYLTRAAYQPSDDYKCRRCGGYHLTSNQRKFRR